MGQEEWKRMSKTLGRDGTGLVPSVVPVSVLCVHTHTLDKKGMVMEEEDQDISHCAALVVDGHVWPFSPSSTEGKGGGDG